MIKKVTVKKLHFEDLEVLQTELDIYKKYVAIHQLTNDFLNTIITFDTCNGLYFFILNKLHYCKKDYNVIFTITQAATILKCCYFNRKDRDVYTKHVMTKLSIDLDKQLKNIQ